MRLMFEISDDPRGPFLRIYGGTEGVIDMPSPDEIKVMGLVLQRLGNPLELIRTALDVPDE